MNKQIILLIIIALIAGIIYWASQTQKAAQTETIPNQSETSGDLDQSQLEIQQTPGSQPPATESGTQGPTAGNSTSTTACTLEAKICPDGSSVGRTGPNCEFAPCPSETSCNGTTCTATTSQEITCSDELRAGDACAQIYDPVCATVQIQCIKAPCNPIKQTFSNACTACHNKLVPGYSKGECQN